MKRSVLNVCVILCLAGWLQAQSPDGTATVAGTILDQVGKPIVAASVMVKND